MPTESKNLGNVSINRNNQKPHCKGETIMRTNTSKLTNQEVFNKEVVTALETFYGEGYHIQINQVIKNNDTILFGLTILEENSIISPSIYLNEYFADYQNGRTLNSIINEIMKIYEKNKLPQIPTNVSDIIEFQKVKNKIVIKLINREGNSAFLKDTPFIPFCDLAIIFNIIVSTNEDGTATITVKNNILHDYWKMDADSLLELAIENSKQLIPAKIQSMEEVLREMLGRDFVTQLGIDTDMYSDIELDALFQEISGGNQGTAMYVASNVSRVNGASVMLYDDLLYYFSKKLEKNLFIIPSSIHELIVVPDTGYMKTNDIRSMVMDVNATQVAPDEVLSDNVYYYDRNTDTITLA